MKLNFFCKIHLVLWSQINYGHLSASILPHKKIVWFYGALAVTGTMVNLLDIIHWSLGTTENFVAPVRRFVGSMWEMFPHPGSVRCPACISTHWTCTGNFVYISSCSISTATIWCPVGHLVGCLKSIRSIPKSCFKLADARQGTHDVVLV